MRFNALKPMPVDLTPSTTGASDLQSIRILGSDVDLVEIPDVIAAMNYWIGSEHDRFHYVVNTGMHGLMEGHRDPEFKAILNSADLFAPDGILVVLIARAKGAHIKKKGTGPDLMERFLESTHQKGYRHFFYGDTVETLGLLSEKMSSRYPNQRVVGVHSPPFRPATAEEDDSIVEEINRAKPDVLWIGLGTPKQERWIFEHRERLKVPMAIGVGATFKFATGSVQRAPSWLGNLGFEWLWRLSHEPKRLWRRVFIDAPQFVALAVLELTGLKKFE